MKLTSMTDSLIQNGSDSSNRWHSLVHPKSPTVLVNASRKHAASKHSSIDIVIGTSGGILMGGNS